MVAVGGVEGLAMGECTFDVLEPAAGFGEGAQGFAVERGFEGATVGVAAEDGVLHFEDVDGVFDGGGAAVYVSACDGNNVAGIAGDEEVAGPGLEDQVGDDAGVRAGDEEVLRGLALGEEMELVAFAGEYLVVKAFVSFEQPVHIFAAPPSISVSQDGCKAVKHLFPIC